MNIGIIGAGNLGTALAVCFARSGHRVGVWDVDETVLQAMRKKRVNPRLPGVVIPRSVRVATDIEEVTHEAMLVILCVPSQAVAAASKMLDKAISKMAVVLAAAKGWDAKTHLLPHQTLAAEAPSLRSRIGTLGGSAVAAQFVRGLPTTFVVGAKNIKSIAPVVRRAFLSPTVCVEINNDPDGVAIGGAMKNPYAIGIGILDGLGSSSNTKAMLVAAAHQEMIALGMALGAKRETIGGLAGLGDLIGTSFAEESRNRKYGDAIGRKGLHGAGALRERAEGVRAAPIALGLARERGIRLRVLSAIQDIISGKEKPAALYRDLAGLCLR